jgi:hypothetical protein
MFFKIHFSISRPQKKKSIARRGGGLSTCLRNRRFHRLSWSKTRFEKLGFGLGPDIAIIGGFTGDIPLLVVSIN